jgi:formylmethanofuran dehydrogenase subunit C
MKTTILLSAAIIGISAFAFATNETNELSTTSYDPGKFYGIIVNSGANIILSQDDHNSIRMEGNSKEIDAISTQVENGALVINGSNSRSVNIYISVEDLSLIEINGSARVFSIGSINSDILLLKVNGNGSMKVDVRTLTVGMIVKGGGKIIVSGNTGESYSRIYGSGNIYSDNLDSFKQTNERMVIQDEKSPRKKLTLKLHQ